MTQDRARRASSVAAMASAHLINDSYAYMLPALLPLLIGKLGIGLGLAGLLVTLYQASSSFTQPVFGHMSDRGGRTRWMAWTGVALSGCAAALLGLAPSFAAVAIALLAGGLGTALYHPVSAALVAGS
ncbi:MAG TPA: MFS transporter, partial [Candidatus Limnocylindria bacterium]|nr:MFS transporter [Candidatus Limnocylindria bacterium]